jgi:hypothetical protein
MNVVKGVDAVRRELNLLNLRILLVTIFLLSIQAAPAQQTETTAKAADKLPRKSGFTTADQVVRQTREFLLN